MAFAVICFQKKPGLSKVSPLERSLLKFEKRRKEIHVPLENFSRFAFCVLYMLWLTVIDNCHCFIQRKDFDYMNEPYFVIPGISRLFDEIIVSSF